MIDGYSSTLVRWIHFLSAPSIYAYPVCWMGSYMWILLFGRGVSLLIYLLLPTCSGHGFVGAYFFCPGVFRFPLLDGQRIYHHRLSLAE